MLSFHTSVHGGRLPTATLPVTFDDAVAALQKLDRLFIEPDGSFVWMGRSPDNQAWQVDGNLIDRGEFLAYVELKGRCPEEQFDLLLSAFGWPGAELVFQLPRRGAFLAEPEFRALAASDEGAV